MSSASHTCTVKVLHSQPASQPWRYTQNYNIDKEIEKCNLCICNSVEEKQLKEGWKSVIVHNSREEEILEEIKKVVHP